MFLGATFGLVAGFPGTFFGTSTAVDDRFFLVLEGFLRLTAVLFAGFLLTLSLAFALSFTGALLVEVDEVGFLAARTLLFGEDVSAFSTELDPASEIMYNPGNSY